MVGPRVLDLAAVLDELLERLRQDGFDSALPVLNQLILLKQRRAAALNLTVALREDTAIRARDVRSAACAEYATHMWQQLCLRAHAHC